VFLLPVGPAELVVRTLTVTGYGVGHWIAALKTGAVCRRQYGRSVRAEGAVFIGYTCVLVCCAFVSTRARAATRASSGAGQAPGGSSRTSSIRPSGAARGPLAGDRRTSSFTDRGASASSRGTSTRRASRAPGIEVTNAVISPASTTSTRTRSGLSAATPTRLQTGPVGARQAREANYDKGCSAGWHLEHGGLRVFAVSNTRAAIWRCAWTGDSPATTLMQMRCRLRILRAGGLHDRSLTCRHKSNPSRCEGIGPTVAALD
jgi:hypothetical protein